MNFSPLTFLTFLVLAAPIALWSQYSSSSDPEWLYIQKVTFVSGHDQARIRLDPIGEIYLDADEFYANLWGEETEEIPESALRFEHINNWKAGRLIEIRYSKQTGAVFFDPESGRHIMIAVGLKTHPITSLWKDRLLETSNADMAMVEQYFSELWEHEIQRLFDKIEQRLGPKEAVNVALAREAWKTYRDLQLVLLYSLDRGKEGTLWGWKFGNHSILFQEAQVTKMLAWFNY